MSAKFLRTCAWMFCAIIVGGLIIAPVEAETISWNNSGSGIWGTAGHWLPPEVPDSDDDAKHLTMLNHIEVEADHSCLSFEGTSGVTDRYLLVKSRHWLDIGAGGLFKTTGPGAPLVNFPVKFEDGVSGDGTAIFIDGLTEGIDFIPGSRWKGDFVTIRCWGGLKDSSVSLGDNSLVGAAYANFESASITLGDDGTISVPGGDVTGPGDHSVAWTVGDRGTVNVTRVSQTGGNLEGVDMTIGTPAASSTSDRTYVNTWRVGNSAPITDEWLLRGYASFTVENAFYAADETAHIVLEDNAVMSVGTVAEHGSWDLSDSSILFVDFNFVPDVLVMDGGLVSGQRVGEKGGAPWNLTMKNGARIDTENPPYPPAHGEVDLSGTWFGYPNNSILTYVGKGNVIDTPWMDLGAELVREG